MSITVRPAPQPRRWDTHPRRFPVGAELGTEGVHFRVWAPRAQTIAVKIEGGAGAGSLIELKRESDDYFSGLAPQAKSGSLYRFQIDGLGSYADPASRFQPQGPHGPSEVIDP